MVYRLQEVTAHWMAPNSESVASAPDKGGSGAIGFLDELPCSVLRRVRGAFSKEEKLAAELAERFVFDHVALRSDEAFWQRMKSSFSDQQILELLSLIGFCLGVGRLLAVLDVANDCPINLTADPGEDPSFYAHG